MSQLEPITPDVLRILTPRERLSVSEWASKHFEIREKGAIRPGPYDLSWTPYWREPLDAAGDPYTRRMNVVAAAQTGKTKLGEIVVAFTARHRPTNVLYVRPTDDDVVEAFRDRFGPMIEANLSDMIPARGEFMTTSKNPVISLRSLMIYGAAATIPRQLTSRTAPLIFYDETDSGGDVDNALGNVLDLTDERQMAASAMHALTLGVSTAKYTTGSNWLAYQASDRATYREPCPRCGTYQPLKLTDLHAPPDATPEQIREERLARWQCDACKSWHTDSLQDWMSDRGRWCPAAQRFDQRLNLKDHDLVENRSLAIAPDPDRWMPRRVGPEPSRRHRGFQVWRANTKFEQANWSAILARWLEVKKSRDPTRLQVFVNNWLAEAWSEAIEAADEAMLRSRIGVYEPRVVPTRAKLVLGAIDVQGDCLWYVFRAFGAQQMSWLIQYGSIEVQQDAYTAALDTIYEDAMLQGWPIAGSPDLRMRAYAIACDSGYRTDEVYEFARRPAVIATKGQQSADYRVRVVQVEGKKRPDPLNLYHLNTRAFKDRLQRLIKTAAGEPGEWNLHAETTDEYLAHLTAEHLVHPPGNPRRRSWQPKTTGRPNHLLDCEAAILGLAEALEQRREVSLMTIQETDPQLGVFRRRPDEPQEPGPGPAPSRKRRRNRSSSGFLPDRPRFL